MQKCRVLMSAVKRAWAVPYISIMMFEAGPSGSSVVLVFHD